MKVALVHEWLSTYAGSEKVLEALIRLYPDARLYTLVDFVDAKDRAFLQGKHPKVSFIQRLPFARGKFRHYLPLMPLAIEQLDLSAYDLVISSHHAVAKGVVTGPDQLHVSYVHTPMRYAWDLQHQYLKESGFEKGPLSWLVRGVLHYLRLWDHGSAQRVDAMAANSDFIRRRIAKAWRREATVIHPPVETAAIPIGTERGDFYLAASRLVPYKRMDLIVEAFSKTPHRPLKIIGQGPEMGRLKAIAAPHIEFLGFQPDPVLWAHLGRARAFVFAAEEDFGILPVEAQAAGTPVIAYGKGGALETVIAEGAAHPTGLFFKEPTPRALLDALDRFEEIEHQFEREPIRKHAERFSSDRFEREWRAFIDAELTAHFGKIGSRRLRHRHVDPKRA